MAVNKVVLGMVHRERFTIGGDLETLTVAVRVELDTMVDRVDVFRVIESRSGYYVTDRVEEKKKEVYVSIRIGELKHFLDEFDVKLELDNNTCYIVDMYNNSKINPNGQLIMGETVLTSGEQDIWKKVDEYLAQPVEK